MFNKIITKRTVGRLSTPDDEKLILTILEENINTTVLLSEDPDHSGVARNMANHRDIPPGGKKKNLRNILLFEKDSNDPIGLLGCYFGYPKNNVMYLGCLFLRPNYHRKGLGKEIVTQIEQDVRNYNIDEIRIGVGLKNWRALLFWTNLGYDKITKITGDKEFGDNKFAIVELTKNLKHDLQHLPQDR
ncbi:MAG: GNAT family N-acetyltransferase [Proteobacteria bacterium]|nr:GNAT family N-acetyltransferase [Pseudomonadota bacterium]